MTMKNISPGELLDIATSGTTATLLARRWESAMLVNVENATLERLLNNPKAMEALMSIEGFRNLNMQSDIEIIVNKSNAVKKIKKEATDEGRDLTEKEKKKFQKKKRNTNQKGNKFKKNLSSSQLEFQSLCI